MPLISIIIPIYNVENYIRNTLLSIQAQTYSEFEVLMVDDGSADGTALICQEFAREDARFTYYYKENGGSSSARNYGLKRANGDYVAFVDSDDTLKPDYLQQLAEGCAKDDTCVVMSGIETLRGDTTFYTLSLPHKEWDGSAFQQYVLCREIPIFLFQSSCAKLYQREWVLENKILFDESVCVSEDSLFNIELLSKFEADDRVITLPYVGYQYRWDNENSIQRSARTFQKAKQGITANMQTLLIRKHLAEEHFPDDEKVQKGVRQAFASVAIYNAQDIETNGYSDEQRRELYDVYLDDIQTELGDELSSRPYSERKILTYTMTKNRKGIHRIYRLRALKKKFASFLPGK